MKMAAKLGKPLTKEEVSVLIGLGCKEGREFIACSHIPEQAQVECALIQYPITDERALDIYTNTCIRLIKIPDCKLWAHLLEYESDE